MVLLHCMSGDKRFRSCLHAAPSCILFLLQSDSLQFQLTTKNEIGPLFLLLPLCNTSLTNLHASKLYIEDLTDEFVEDYVIPTMQAGADYEGYLLGTSFARPDHQHIEQCRQYDRPHGNAAGRHGHCGSAPESCLSCCSEIRKKAVRHRSRAAFTTTRMCLYETTQTIHSAGNGPHRSRCAGRCLRLLCSTGCTVSRLHRPAHTGDPVFPDDGHGRAAAAGLF